MKNFLLNRLLIWSVHFDKETIVIFVYSNLK